MSDIEARLRSALDARAQLVQPEDLNLNPVYEPPAPDPTPWWQRPSSFLFVAAVAVIVIALPLLALAATGPEREEKDPDRVATSSPSPSQTMTDPVLPPAQTDEADVDGDGVDDRIDVADDGRVEVALSASGTTATYEAAAGALIGATANVDGRRGEEVVIVVDAGSIDVHRGTPLVLSLRSGALDQILVGDIGGTGGAAGQPETLTYWWVREGELMWWQSQEPQDLGGNTPYPVDVQRFPRADRLVGEPFGTFCVTGTMPQNLQECAGEGGEDPEPPTSTATDDPPATAEDTWWDETPPGLPPVWSREHTISLGTWVSGDVDGDGAHETYRITAGNQLQVRTDAELLSVDLPPGPAPSLEGLAQLDGLDRQVILLHTTEGAAGSTYVAWSAYALMGGELVRLGTAPAGPPLTTQVSNLPPADGGHPTTLTWRPGPEGLYGMDYLARAQAPGPDGADIWVYRVRVRSWYVDGTLLRATTLTASACVAPAVGNGFSACPDGL